MSFFEHIVNAVRSILSNKLRTVLSSLGIIIGVSSVIVLLAFGEGTERQVTSSIESLGTNLLTLSVGGSRQGGIGGSSSAQASKTNIFTREDVEIIKKISGVSKVSPQVSARKQVIYSSANTSTTLYGVTPEYFSIRNLSLDAGYLWVDDDNEEKTVVLGSETAVLLFENQSPIGKDIQIGNGFYTVVGVLASKGSSGPNNQDNSVYMPISTLQGRISGSKYISSFFISAESSEVMESVKESIQTVFLKKLNIEDVSSSPFSLSSSQDALETISTVTNTLKVFLGGIAAISLVVGGIGIMNIMLVSVSERTREIGIRRAIGALDRDIVLQFLTESCMLTILGGAVGVLLSIAIVKVFAYFGIQAYITSQSVMLALGCSISVGVIFGIIPAYKASKLKPIDALRAE